MEDMLHIVSSFVMSFCALTNSFRQVTDMYQHPELGVLFQTTGDDVDKISKLVDNIHNNITFINVVLSSTKSVLDVYMNAPPKTLKPQDYKRRSPSPSAAAASPPAAVSPSAGAVAAPTATGGGQIEIKADTEDSCSPKCQGIPKPEPPPKLEGCDPACQGIPVQAPEPPVEPPVARPEKKEKKKTVERCHHSCTGIEQSSESSTSSDDETESSQTAPKKGSIKRMSPQKKKALEAASIKEQSRKQIANLNSIKNKMTDLQNVVSNMEHEIIGLEKSLAPNDLPSNSKQIYDLIHSRPSPTDSQGFDPYLVSSPLSVQVGTPGGAAAYCAARRAKKATREAVPGFMQSLNIAALPGLSKSSPESSPTKSSQAERASQSLKSASKSSPKSKSASPVKEPSPQFQSI